MKKVIAWAVRTIELAVITTFWAAMVAFFVMIASMSVLTISDLFRLVITGLAAIFGTVALVALFGAACRAADWARKQIRK